MWSHNVLSCPKLADFAAVHVKPRELLSVRYSQYHSLLQCKDVFFYFLFFRACSSGAQDFVPRKSQAPPQLLFNHTYRITVMPQSQVSSLLYQCSDNDMIQRNCLPSITRAELICLLLFRPRTTGFDPGTFVRGSNALITQLLSTSRKEVLLILIMILCPLIITMYFPKLNLKFKFTLQNIQEHQINLKLRNGLYKDYRQQPRYQ